MKTMKKPVTMIIMFAMALLLAACGSNREAEGIATTKDVQAESQAAKEEDMAKGPEEEISTEDEDIADDKQEAVTEDDFEKEADTTPVDRTSSGNSSGSNSNRGGSKGNTGNSQNVSVPSEQQHVHNWTAHNSQRWVSQIVTVVDEPERSEKYVRFKICWYNTGTWEETRDPARFEEWANSEYGQLYPFYHIQNVEENPLFLGYNELGLPSFRGDHVMSEGWDVIPAVTHEEDQGYYETYVDYYYCDCGATK